MKRLEINGKWVKVNPTYQNAPYELRYYRGDGGEYFIPNPLRFLNIPDSYDPESLLRNAIPAFILVENPTNQ